MRPLGQRMNRPTEGFLVYTREHEARRAAGLGERGAVAPGPPLTPPEPAPPGTRSQTLRHSGPRTQPPAAAPPRDQPRPRAGGGRSGVAGTGQGRRTSDSGVVPAGVIPAGVVPPGVVPTDAAMIQPPHGGPSSPGQPGRGRGRWAGEVSTTHSGFRSGTASPAGRGLGPGGVGSGRPGSGRCGALCREGPRRCLESPSRDRLVPFSKRGKKRKKKKAI